MSKPSYTQLAWTTAILWLVLVTVLMWQIFASDYRAFLHDNAPDLAQIPSFKTGQVTLVHYLDEDCSCHKFAKPHVAELEKTYIEMNHVYPSKAKPIIEGTNLFERGVASPSVSIYSPEGQLIYYGPYSSGSVCGRGDDLVAAHISKWQDGDKNEYLNVLAQGCFCPWASA